MLFQNIPDSSVLTLYQIDTVQLWWTGQDLNLRHLRVEVLAKGNVATRLGNYQYSANFPFKVLWQLWNRDLNNLLNFKNLSRVRSPASEAIFLLL